jgi:hypothetical protein
VYDDLAAVKLNPDVISKERGWLSLFSNDFWFVFVVTFESFKGKINERK